MAKSAGEAEAVPISYSLSKSAICLQLLVEGLQRVMNKNRTIKISAFSDNKAAIQAIEAGSSATMRYIAKTQGIHLSWLHDIFEKDEYSLTKIETAKNKSDILTKALLRIKTSIIFGNAWH